jgi:NTP pyrophosphatase (non-canonical NTP hydrolase)
MNFIEYQHYSRKTAIYPKLGKNFLYPTIGLFGECGEIAEKIKKIIRDKHNKVSEADKMEIKKELGDVLWYISALCSELKLSLNDVAESNINKLQSRKARNILHGNGDNR